MKDKKLIVVADDNKDFCDAVTVCLREDGYERVDCVNNGYELISYLERKTPSLIILDLVMPGKDGITVFDTVKSLAPYTRIVIYTGHENYKDTVYARNSDRFILKGANIEELINAVNELA